MRLLQGHESHFVPSTAIYLSGARKACLETPEFGWPWTGVDHREGEFSPGGPRDRRAGTVALSSLFLSILRVLLHSVSRSHRVAPCSAHLKENETVLLFFVPFRPILSHSLLLIWSVRNMAGLTQRGTSNHEFYESHEWRPGHEHSKRTNSTFISLGTEEAPAVDRGTCGHRDSLALTKSMTQMTQMTQGCICCARAAATAWPSRSPHGGRSPLVPLFLTGKGRASKIQNELRLRFSCG